MVESMGDTKRDNKIANWYYDSEEHQHHRVRKSGNLESTRHHLALPQNNKQHFNKVFLDILCCA